jgi:hypothetical protein
VTVALLTKVLPVAADVAVTGITKPFTAPGANPLTTVHVKAKPLNVHPLGNVPTVKFPGNVSLITASAVVAAVPTLLSCNV